MSLLKTSSGGGKLLEVRGIKIPDIFVLGLAVFLPWSTSIATTFAWLSVVSIMASANLEDFSRSLKLPSRYLPLLLLVIAVMGTAWGIAPWNERIRALGPVSKLLALPVFLFYFQGSARAPWVLFTFLASSMILLLASWTVFFVPELTARSTINPGVPVKNYIDQSQTFLLCLIGLAVFLWASVNRMHWSISVAIAALMSGLLANLMFVVSSRTALVSLPILFVIFSIRCFRLAPALAIVVCSLFTAGMISSASPYLRARLDNTLHEYQAYRVNVSSSVGKRLEFWHKSVVFFADAPLLGNGTGSVKALFQDAAVGQNGLSAEVIANPHNQILNVAVQWGLVGVVLLVGMWWSHIWLFRTAGLASSVGLAVVTQNIIGSLFNSHIFDFVEGWIYVIGVGVAGGLVAQGERATKPQAS